MRPPPPAHSPGRPYRALQALAAGAPVMFTGAWLLLGASTPGYSQRADTISALAARGAPHAEPMVAAFVVQGLGQLAGARLAWSAPDERWVGRWLAVAGAGTLLAGVVQLPAAAGPGWRSGAHALAATAAFGGLHLAVLSGARTRSPPHWLRGSAALALGLAVPHTAWFLAQLRSGGAWEGYAEKAFTTVLLAWCAALALGRRGPT